jgi:hypothetical protein
MKKEDISNLTGGVLRLGLPFLNRFRKKSAGFI